MNVRFTLDTKIQPSKREPLEATATNSVTGPREVRIVLAVPRRPPSMNDWHGKKAFAYTVIRNEWAKEIPPLSTTWRASGKRIVEVYRYMGKGERPFDDRNRHGGMKPIEDVFRAKGYLAGDTDAEVGMGFAREIYTVERRPWTIFVFRDPVPCSGCSAAIVSVAVACDTCGGWGVL